MEQELGYRSSKSVSWSEEYKEVVRALEAAEGRKKKVEENLRSLHKMQKGLELDLLVASEDVIRLKISRNAMNCNKDSDGRKLAVDRLFLLQLNSKTTSEGLVRHFERYGDVEDAYVVRFPDSQLSRGFGYVKFTEDSMAENAMGYTHWIDGKLIKMQWAWEKKDRKDNRISGHRHKPY